MRTTYLALLAALTGCDLLGPIVHSHYDTLADARKDELFDRGWLPDVLPRSASDIETRNDLDGNTSTGRFSFLPGTGDVFFDALTPGAPSESVFANWQRIVETYASDGLQPWMFAEGRTVWVFFCDADECEYLMWLDD